MELYTYHSVADAANVGDVDPADSNDVSKDEDDDDDRNVTPHKRREKGKNKDDFLQHIDIKQLLSFRYQFTHLAKMNVIGGRHRIHFFASRIKGGCILR